MPATEVLETVQLVVSMELLAISSMSEVRSEHKVCFVIKRSEFLSFFHRVELVAMFLRIQNLEGHQNCIVGLKVTMI